MADFNTVARPYANAVFQLARDNNALAKWSETLELLATVAADERIHALLASPRLAPTQTEQLFLDICGEHLDDAGRNFIRLLAEQHRLIVLPTIRSQYQALRANEEGTLEARVISAKELDETVQASLEKALSGRLGRTVTLSSEIDESLLGGAVIRAGDLVIDGSVQGRLKRLAAALNR